MHPCLSRLKLSFDLPDAVLGSLAGATVLRQLTVHLQGPEGWMEEWEAVQFAGLPMEALAALPSLGTLEELKMTVDDDPLNVRYDLVDARAELIEERRSAPLLGSLAAEEPAGSCGAPAAAH